MALIIAFCILIVLGLDYLFIQRLNISNKSRQRWLYLLVAIDILPQVITQPFYLFSPDNFALMGHISRWAMFSFLVLGIARQPFNITFLISRNRWVRAAGAICGICAATIFIYGMAVTRTNYIINRVTIFSDRLPKSFDGYRVVQLSDLHTGTMVNATREIGKVVEICNSSDADAVTFCGDLIDSRYHEITPNVAQELKQLKARDGIFSITGNHDIGVYVRDSIRLTPKENTRRLIAIEHKLGWHVLDNQTDYITRGADSISITGISFSQSLQEDRHSANHSGVRLDSIYNSVPKELFNISLSHMPQLWDNIRELHPADLTLAGHVHAMQIAIKVGQWRISPSMLLYKRWSGLYQEGEQYLYINDGIGYGLYPMRIGARPEITIFELKSTKQHN